MQAELKLKPESEKPFFGCTFCKVPYMERHDYSCHYTGKAYKKQCKTVVKISTPLPSSPKCDCGCGCQHTTHNQTCNLCKAGYHHGDNAWS